jgi:hypothetical protein
MGFQVPKAVLMKNSVFWNETPCITWRVNRRFGVIFRLNIQALLATCFQAGLLLGLSFDSEDGDEMLLRNAFDFQWTAWRYVPEDQTPDNLYYIYSSLV